MAVADYAATAPAGALVSQTSVAAYAMAGSSRQPLARDKLGNIYTVAPNSSGNLVAYKFGPMGLPGGSAVLDATATSVNTAQLFQLQSGAYVCVYARASGALYFVIFDAVLSLIAGPVSIATEYHSTNIVYHSSCVLNGGGFAVAFQTSAGTAINLAVYSNTGSVVTASVAIQTLAASAAQEFLRLGQLASGNLVCAFRGTMTAGGNAGTGFLIVTTAGVNVSGPTPVDTTAVAGFLELSVLPTTFALAEANGTSLIAAVFNNAGTQQGTNFSVGTTLNSTTYPQVKLCNDGIGYWLAWFSSTANGLFVITIAASGTAGASASALGGSTLSASTYALDAEIVNGMLVALAASSGTAGQFWMTVGLPDASLGIVNPYSRTAPAAFGAAAATTGTNWPRIISGGGGLYTGAGGPTGQPSISPVCGDFTVILAYDQQNVGGTFIGVQKVEASAILGVALSGVAGSSPGSQLYINPGPGEYPTNTIGGTPGTSFNHIGLTPAGTSGALYPNGISGTGIGGSAGGGSSAGFQAGDIKIAAGLSTTQFGFLLAFGQAISRSAFPALFAAIGTTFGVGDGSTTFNVPDLRGRIPAGLDAMGGTPANRLGSGNSGGITGAATLGANGGQQSHTLASSEQADSSSIFIVNTSSVGANFGFADSSPVGQALYANPTVGFGNGAHNNVQPTICLNIFIKT